MAATPQGKHGEGVLDGSGRADKRTMLGGEDQLPLRSRIAVVVTVTIMCLVIIEVTVDVSGAVLIEAAPVGTLGSDN